MLGSESAITGETWKAGYTNVNLNPDTELPIEVWLSKISEHLVAAGEPDRLIQHGYTPSDEEVMMEHGKRHLRAIKVPVLYQILDDAGKKMSMDLLSSPSFDWSSTAVLSAPITLKLTVGKNLAHMFKFIKAMQEAVELGVAETGDLVPDWSLERLNNKSLVTIRASRDHVKPSENEIGISRHSDLASFSLRALPNESAKKHFSRLCLARARGGALRVPTGLEVTPLQIRVLQPSERDLTVGNLLKEANTHRGAKLGLRRMNMLGEVDGLCRVTNTDTRVDKLMQSLRLSATHEELCTRKQGVLSLKKQSKLVVAGAVAERKKKAGEKRATVQNQISQLTSLLASAPTNGKKHSAAELKAFIQNKLEGKYPAVPGAKSMSVVVPYLLLVNSKTSDLGVSVIMAALFARNDLEQKQVGEAEAADEAKTEELEGKEAMEVQVDHVEVEVVEGKGGDGEDEEEKEEKEKEKEKEEE